jgi:predicted metalloprotease with PDZ domain
MPTATERVLAGPGGYGPACWFSIGLRVGGDGTIGDVRWNGPADRARLAPGEKILAVDGQIFSADALREAIRAAKGSAEPIRLILQADSFVSMAEIDYHDGERYPALERVEGVPAYLDDIARPSTKPEKAPAEANKDEE